ncbi:response regulator [Emticicia sp. C21]|uniref:response regulator n=1 Tax=Emticicia sp. C21 TaxID=2302915 RepID=UPI000E351F9D|nr:response regulator [Emticicia sp. C21]RFS17278.1 response regulator [Emticicia sp. C21]
MKKVIHVLLIDDDPEDHLFFEMAVSDIELSIECHFADNGIKGLTMLSNDAFKPDFIFLDVNMLKMNGMECLAKIKEIKRLNEVPVYMYSTSADKLLAEKCLKSGATGLIKKETDISDIRNKLLGIFTTQTSPD